ncbi:Glycosyl transferase family 31, partial [Trinorchestia longiramus]
SFSCHNAHNAEHKSNRWCCLLRVLQICLFMLLIYCVYVILSLRDAQHLSKFDPQTPFNARRPLESDVDYDLKFVHNNVNENISKLTNNSSFSVVRARVLHAPLLLCVGSPVDIIILVHTSPSNLIQRNSIRRTWGGVRALPDGRSVALLFVMGLPFKEKSPAIREPNDRALKELTRNEAARHQDILIGNFYDTYHNLSIKHELGLRWCTLHCSRSSLILKADDDAFVDVFGLFSFLARTLEMLTPSHMLACDVIPEGTIPKRSGKWAVEKDLYSESSYPRYCSGLAYVMSMDVAKAVIEKTNVEPWLWVDDVWVTGLLTKHLNVHYILLNARYCYDLDRLELWLAKDNVSSMSPCTVAHLDAGAAGYASTLNKLWLH